MDLSKLSQYDEIPTAEFLQNYDFGAMLREFKGSEGRDFQDRCRGFIDRFVELVLAQQAASSEFMSGLYCFCPELLLEGDDKHVFDLFNRFARRLERCGVISDVECKSAVEEFRTFVVDVRGRHAASDEVAENIPDVISYLLGDYSFLARKNLCRVFVAELCCLVVLKPRQKHPDVDIDLSGCAVPYWTVTSCIRGVQSCVLSSNYKQKAFFTKHTMVSVRNAINGAQDFMNLASFDPWGRIGCGGQESFVARYLELFNAFLSRKKGESHSALRHANKRERKMLAAEGAQCQLCHVRRVHHHLLFVLLSLQLLRRHIYIAVLAHYWVERKTLELSRSELLVRLKCLRRGPLGRVLMPQQRNNRICRC